MKIEQIKEKQKQLCFDSLSFCCDKECPLRNKVIGELGLTKGEFYKLKKDFDKSLEDVLVKK